MRFTLEVQMDSAAFEEDAGELSDILATLARRLAGTLTGGEDDIGETGKVRDVNGNTVGSWEIGA